MGQIMSENNLNVIELFEKDLDIKREKVIVGYKEYVWSNSSN